MTTLGTGDVVPVSAVYRALTVVEAALGFSVFTMVLTTETHRSYPVLRYFHFHEHHYALPRVLLVALDTHALLHSVLDERCCQPLLRSPAVFELQAAATELIGELLPQAEMTQVPRERELEWGHRFRDAAEILRAAGVDVAPDLQTASHTYTALRERWDSSLRALTGAMVYEWREVERPLR